MIALCCMSTAFYACCFCLQICFALLFPLSLNMFAERQPFALLAFTLCFLQREESCCSLADCLPWTVYLLPHVVFLFCIAEAWQRRWHMDSAVWCIHRLFEIQYSSLHYALWVQTQVNTLLMQAVHMHWIIHWMAPRYYTAWRIWSNAAWWPLPGSTWMLCWEWQLHKHVPRQLQSSNSWRLE